MVLALAPLIEVSPAKRKGLIEVRRHNELMFMWLGAVLRPTLHAVVTKTRRYARDGLSIRSLA